MKTCLECQRILIGRDDKKFCNDACRSTFNNKSYRLQNQTVRHTNLILKRNYRILQHLVACGRCNIGRQELLRQGFAPDYVTRVSRTATGRTVYFLYDHTFSKADKSNRLRLEKTESDHPKPPA